MFPSSVAGRLLIAFLFGFFVFMFLRVFLPYGLENIPVNKTLFISAYGISTTLIILLWLFISPRLIPGIYLPGHFTFRGYLILCLGNTMLINTVNWAYTRIAGAGMLPSYDFIFFTFLTFSVGVFPVLFLTLIIDRIRLNIRISQVISRQVNRVTEKDQHIDPKKFHILNNTGTVQFHLLEKDFICARSNENYTVIFKRHKNSIQKELLRISLTDFHEQVNGSNYIIRCHRSAVVNIKHIKRIIIKSRDIELQLGGIEGPIPVSRVLPRELLKSPFCGMEVNGNQSDQTPLAGQL